MQLPIVKEAKIKVSPTLTHSLWVSAQQHHLSWSECMEVGVQMKLADKGLMDYPETTLKIKFNKMRVLYESLLKETSKKGVKQNDRKPTKE